jgi:hypothetical protein
MRSHRDMGGASSSCADSSVIRLPSGSASTPRTVPVTMVAWVGRVSSGGARQVANCTAARPIAAAASAIMMARSTGREPRSTAAITAGTATAAPSQPGGSARSAK